MEASAPEQRLAARLQTASSSISGTVLISASIVIAAATSVTRVSQKITFRAATDLIVNGPGLFAEGVVILFPGKRPSVMKLPLVRFMELSVEENENVPLINLLPAT